MPGDPKVYNILKFTKCWLYKYGILTGIFLNGLTFCTKVQIFFYENNCIPPPKCSLEIAASHFGSYRQLCGLKKLDFRFLFNKSKISFLLPNRNSAQKQECSKTFLCGIKILNIVCHQQSAPAYENDVCGASCS